MSGEIQVLFIGSVRPEPTTAASLTLYRHLVGRAGIALSVLPAELQDILPDRRLARGLARANRTRFSRWVADLEFGLHGRLALDRRLPPPPSTGRSRTLVLTLAYRNGWQVARRYAIRHGLPLVVRFDDWGPDIAAVHAPVRRILERRFCRLAEESATSICISQGMCSALGSVPNSAVVLPIPGENIPAAPVDASPATPLRVCYLGNMYDYGPMLAGLAERALSDSALRLEFRGNNPQWPEGLKAIMRQHGRLHDFQTGPQFQRWYEGFHVYLVAMFFESRQRRRVETCFATKLVEYSALGRPIVIWAPESAAVVRWARATGTAMCVTDPSPDALLAALRGLAANARRRVELGCAARHAYNTDFNPENIQSGFVAALETALTSSSSRPRIR